MRDVSFMYTTYFFFNIPDSIFTTTMENSKEIPQKKLKIKLPYDPMILFLGIAKENKDTFSKTCIYEPQFP